ncbi:MAG: hypothetical protein IJ034_01515, partial [Mailhella sp.]|nr:hypothetical protein [Mailhella sp.]
DTGDSTEAAEHEQCGDHKAKPVRQRLAAEPENAFIKQKKDTAKERIRSRHLRQEPFSQGAADAGRRRAARASPDTEKPPSPAMGKGGFHKEVLG